MILVSSSVPTLATADEQGCSYRVSPLTVSVPGAGGTGQINVVTNAGCTWTASTGGSWLTVSPSQGEGSGTVTWVGAANTLRTQRFGSLSVAGRTVFMSQGQGSATATAVPGPPRQLTASISGSSLTLTWSPPDSGGAPSTYVIGAGTASGVSNIASFATGSPQTLFSAQNVPGGVYFIRVSAQNAAGTSPPSNEVTFTVGAQTCSGAPPPSALQAAVNGSLVTLSWMAPPGGAPAMSYLVEVGTSESTSDLGTFNTGFSLTTFGGNAAPGRYFVRVRATTACGVTAPSATIEVVVH